MKHSAASPSRVSRRRCKKIRGPGVESGRRGFGVKAFAVHPTVTPPNTIKLFNETRGGADLPKTDH